MACLGRDELLELRGQHASPSAEPLQSPKCLLVPGSLVAAPTDVATFEEEAFVSFLQVAGRPLSLRTLISLAETFQLGMSDQRHDTVAKVKRRKGKKRQPAVPEGDEEQEEGDEEDEGAEENGGEVNSKSSRRASFGANCSTEDLVRTWIQRRPDLFRPRLTPLELDTEVELACSVPLVTFQLPPFRILSEAPTDNDPEKHLQRLSRSLYEAEPNYLAVLPKNAEELSESKAENFLQLAALQDSLLTSVYGHLKKKMHRVQGPAIVPKRSGEDDTQHLLRAFRKHVEKEGYLSSAAVRAELDSICSLRECSQTQLLKDQRLGPIFLAQMKMQMFIDTTIWVAITSWPIVTYHDLESTIMKGADFQQQHRFADCGLGSLIYHPMVAHFFFGHEGDKDPQSMPPREFPKITSEQLLYLMVKGFFNNEGEFFHKKFEKEWSLEAGLAAAAASLGLPSYKGIGVYVQREFVVKQVLKQALHRREAIMRRCKGVIQESVKAGQLGSLPSWDHSRWGPFFKSLKSLRSLPEQVAYIKHVLQKEVRGIRGTGDLEAAVESIFTPLLLLAISAAHVSSKDKSGDQLEAVVNTASQLKELLPPGSNLDEPAQALRAFPSRETSLAKALLASERAVARICGLSHPSQLPLTLPELLELRPELAEALPKPEDFGRGGGASAGLCGESELTVVQHLIEQLNVSLLSLVESDVGLADLLTALGRSEAAICQQCGVACFADLQLEASFGELMARHSGELSKRMERFVQKAGSGKLHADLSQICSELRAAQLPAPEALQAIQDHFGPAVTAKEVRVAFDQAAPVSPLEDVVTAVESAHALAAQTSGLWRQKRAATRVMGKEEMVQHVAENLSGAPVLMNLRDVLPDWAGNFQPVLGDFSSFLHSSSFRDAWGQHACGSLIVELRWEEFVRLPSCSVNDFFACVEARDALGAAGAALRRWLRDGPTFPADQFASAAEDGFRQMTATGMRETFVLEALAALPTEFREVIVPALVKPYLHMGLPRSNMITVARQSAERTAVLRWLAKFTGITEWFLDWEARYPVHTPGEETVVRDRAPAEAPHVRQKREQAEVSDADSSDGGIISEGTDNDEESSDAVRNEEWANRQLCKKIARNKGVNLQHVDTLTRNWVKAPMNNIYRSLQTTVQGAVKRLAADLYSGEVHFMLELLQNADDCDFAEGCKPSLTVTFESDVKKFGQYTTFEPNVEPIAFLVIEHNEKGFRDFNIRALCDIAQSTKTGDERKYIGAKGIGFKSVFCATSTPIVHSGPFHFHFDSEALGGLGYLIPFPLGRPNGFHLGTRLVLPLYDQPTTDLCRRIVEDLKPELLLFLRKLEEIRVVDSQSQVERVIRKESASDGTNDNVKLLAQTLGVAPEEKTSTSTQEWHVHRKPVSLPKALARDGQRATDLQIAFCQTTENVMEQRPAFAWLPLRSYGFRFILQADWAVPSSREAILAENQLNQCLRRELPNVFCNLIEVLASNALKLPDITQQLIAFKRIYALIPLPGETADFFAESPRSVVHVLSKRNFVLAFDKGSYQLVSPTEVVRPELPKGVDTHLSAEVKKELEGVLNRGRRYIPAEALSGQLAAALHIPDLNDGIAFECLSRLSREDKDKPARTRSDADLGLIHLLFHVVASNTAQPALMQNLRKLAAIPTESGKLHSAADKVYMVDEAMAKTLQGYAEGLNLRFRRMMHAKVEGLFKQLGVLQTDGPRFLKDILLPMLTAETPADVTQLLAATQRVRAILASMKAEQRKSVIPALAEKMWVAVDVFDRSSRQLRTLMQPVRVSQEAVHIHHLPVSILAQWVGPQWFTPSKFYNASAEDQSSFTWPQFWQELGCCPTIHVETTGESKDFRNILQTLERISSTPSLGGAFAQKAASELVEWMTPHGFYYKRFLDGVASAGSPASMSMSDMLRSSPWLPSWPGDRLLTFGNGWVPVPGQSEVTARQSKFLASSAFHSIVHQFAEKWPFLHLAQWPTARIIVRTLKYQSSLPEPVWSSGEMAYVYKSLGWALNHERISRTNWGAEPTPEACEVREHLLQEPWIFLPTRRRGNYKVHDEEAGKFYPSSSVALYDASQLFSDRRQCNSSGYEYVSDEMVRTVSQKVFMRTAKEHYSDKVVQALFKEWGVAPEMGWDAYLDVLRMVDELVNSESPDHVWEHDHALHEIVWRIVRLLGKLPVEEDAEDGKDRGDKLDDNEAAQADEDADFDRAGDFRQLVEEAKNLRIVWTSSRRFRKPCEVLFVADAKSWLDEAKHFATYAKNNKDIMNGWFFLGLRRWEPWSTCQSILPQLKPPDIHEARFARAIYLGGVRSALMKFEAQNKNLTEEARDVIRKAWYLAISIKFFVCSGHSKEEALQAQQVIAVPRCRAQSIGNVVATATDNIASTTLVTMREDIAVARVEKPIFKTHMAGFILSEQRRQLAIALHVPPKAYAADVLQKHPEFAEMLFAELPHVCDVSCIPEEAYTGLQKEAVKTLQNVSWDMWSQGTRGKNVPQTGDIIKAVEDSLKRQAEKCRLSRTQQRTWGLQAALEIDPEEAWRRLLEEEDLFQTEEAEEEESLASGAGAGQGAGEHREGTAVAGSGPAPPCDERPRDDDALSAISEEGSDANEDPLRKFVNRQLEREEERQRPAVRPVSEKEEEGQRPIGRPTAEFPSSTPHGPPVQGGQGGSGSWAGQNPQPVPGEERGPTDPCVGGIGQGGHAENAQGTGWGSGQVPPKQGGGHQGTGQQGQSRSGWSASVAGEEEAPEGGQEESAERQQGGSSGGSHGASHSGSGSGRGGQQTGRADGDGWGPGQPGGAEAAAATANANAAGGTGGAWTSGGAGAGGQGRGAGPGSGQPGGAGVAGRSQAGQNGQAGQKGAGGANFFRPLAPKRSLSAPAALRRSPVESTRPRDMRTEDEVTWKVRASMARSLMETFPSNLTGPHEVVEVLWRIFYENGGPQALYGSSSGQNERTSWEYFVPVDQLFYSHGTISSVFSHGEKRGFNIRSLAIDLDRGRVDMEQDERLRLEVVQYENRLYSLCNRRLFAFKVYQAMMRQRQGDWVQVRAWVRHRTLDPITAKFVLAFTTTCRGERVELRHTAQAAPRGPVR